MNPSLYDLLDVAPDATGDEIRAAWKSAISELDPTDRRFRAYNAAAEVLLDPQQRREYDATLTATATASAGASASPGASASAEAEQPGPTGEHSGAVLTRPPRAGTARSTRHLVPTWALAALAAVTAVSVGASAWLWFGTPSDAAVEESTRAAQSAAERAIGPILSYNAQHLDEDQRAAQAYLTSDYRKEYDKVFAVIKQNAPDTKTVVKADVIASGIVRPGADLVDVLLFVNRPTTNRQTTEPQVYKDQVTVTMKRVDGEWLVDDMASSPVAK